MKQLYNMLVNRQTGIKIRYHRVHDGAKGLKKFWSWVYLFLLNFTYYCLRVKRIGVNPQDDIYEEKKVRLHESSELEKSMDTERLIEKVHIADVVSFDIFDTLIFRPFSAPVDLFSILGEKLEILDFKNIRIMQEQLARLDHFEKNGNYEVSLADIWNRIEREVGISAEAGMRQELELEKTLCYANPKMLKLYDSVRQAKKTIVITSDMYLTSDILRDLLHKNGYSGFKEIYVSSEYGASKAEGSLFEILKKKYQGKKILHIGDNVVSDIENAHKAGLDTFYYENVNKHSIEFRAYDMSALIGSAYRGVVNNHIYCGVQPYSVEYEYGYIYGGLFVLGYCAFIHDYCTKNHVEKVLFLSRDGDILKQVYEKLYPDDEVVYAFLSRLSVTKLMAGFNKFDYYRRFIFHKVNQGYTVQQILKSMELEEYGEQILKDSNISQEDKLTNKNASELKALIENRFDLVKEKYDIQIKGAKKYYDAILKNTSKVVAVDIGWAGSGALSLDYLVNKVWNISCDIIGIVAGTNTIHNAEPDASEPFLQSGKLVSYLYSQSHNRDLLKKHDPNKDYNVFWELLLSSPTPQFKGFYEGNVVRPDSEDKYDKDLDITLQFGKYDANLNGIKEIQKGILDFVSQYRTHFGDPVNGPFAYMYSISGRDAYAPMLVAASDHERYLKAIAKRFDLEINVI